MLVYQRVLATSITPILEVSTTPTPPSFQAISRLQRWIAQGHQRAKPVELVGLVVAALIEPAAKLLEIDWYPKLDWFI